jgi:hypothetical protein
MRLWGGMLARLFLAFWIPKVARTIVIFRLSPTFARVPAKQHRNSRLARAANPLSISAGFLVAARGKDDFEVYDNRQLVTVETFANSVQYKTRPLAVWFALICNQLKFDQRGSGFVRGKTAHLRPALNEMDKTE